MSAGPNSPSADLSSTIDRFSLVMATFRGAPKQTLTEVARHTGIPRTSTLRLLTHLVRVGWLARHGTHYALGDTLAEFGALALYRADFDRVVTPVLHDLHRVTECVVHLGALEGNQVRYLEKVGGSRAPELGTGVGTRVPALSSTLGRTLLGTARPASPDPDGTDVTFGNCSAGYRCIGVRVGTLGGTAVGLSVSGPAHRVRFDRWHAAPVRLAASALARYLDSPTTPPPDGPARRTST